MSTVRGKSARAFVSAVLLSALAGFGCRGSIGERAEDEPIGPSNEGMCQHPLETQLPPVFRSLTGEQYGTVLATAFPSAASAVEAMPNPWLLSEASTEYTTNANAFKMSARSVETLLDGTGAIAAEARAALREEYPCLTESAERSCLENVVDGTLARLYNGEIVASERDSKVEYLAELLEDFSLDLALETFLSTVMMSPRALFRSEMGVDNGDGTATLTALEMAEALSFLLSGNRPDAELRAAIEDGELSLEEMQEHGQRLARIAVRSGPEGFVQELMALEQLEDVFRVDGDEQDALSLEVKAALRAEAEEFVRRAVRAGGPIVDHLLTSETSVAHRLTLPLHGVDEAELTPDEDGFYEVDASERPGLLLQPSMMALLSQRDHTDPVKRGNFVLSRFICFEMPAAPPDVPALAPVESDMPMTVRERLEISHQDPTCNTCHQFMDGIGLSFEAFDHLGRVRTLELGEPVDTSGSVNVRVASLDGELENAQELVQRMGAAGEVQTCVATHAFSYISGIPADPSLDTCLFEANRTIAEDAGGDIIDEFVRILSSELYRVRHMGRVGTITPPPMEPEPEPEPEPRAESCLALRDAGETADGVYTISPLGDESTMDVYCDMTTEGGGWALILSSGGLGPNMLEALAQVTPETPGYLRQDTMMALAGVSSQVALRQVGTSDSLVSTPDSVPIQNLRNAVVLNRDSVPTSATGEVEFWTGTRSGAANIFTSCSVESASYPSIFWTCGNAGGLHLLGDSSSWSYGNPPNNVPLQLWIR